MEESNIETSIAWFFFLDEKNYIKPNSATKSHHKGANYTQGRWTSAYPALPNNKTGGKAKQKQETTQL
jgi:hypothetical protein